VILYAWPKHLKIWRLHISHHIITAEHLGLVAAYLSKQVVTGNYAPEFKYQWIMDPLTEKVPDRSQSHGGCTTDKRKTRTIYPTGAWKITEAERLAGGKQCAGVGRVRCARNIGAAFAYFNEIAHEGDLLSDSYDSCQFRGFQLGSIKRERGEAFRQAAAWASEYYLDNKPSLTPISLCKLIHEIKINMSDSKRFCSGEREKIAEIHKHLRNLCDDGIVRSLWHSRLFKSLPEVWRDDNVYEKFLLGKKSNNE